MPLFWSEPVFLSLDAAGRFVLLHPWHSVSISWCVSAPWQVKSVQEYFCGLSSASLRSSRSAVNSSRCESVEFPTTFSPIPEPTAACDLWGCLWCVGGQSPRVCLCPSWWLLLPTALCLSYCSHRAACCPAFGGDICVCHALLALLPTGSAFHSFLVTHPSFLQCSPEWNMARRAQLCFWLLRLRLFGSRSCVISIASIPPLEMQAHFHQPSEMVTFCSP